MSVSEFFNAGVVQQVTAANPLPINGSVSITGSPIIQVSGQTTSQVSSAASTNATQLRASGTSIFGIVATNTGAAVAFVKYYNKAAAIVVGTDVPMLTIAVPPNGVVAIQPVVPIQMSNGLSLAITNLGPDSDATAVAAGQVKLVTTYS